MAHLTDRDCGYLLFMQKLIERHEQYFDRHVPPSSGMHACFLVLEILAKQEVGFCEPTHALLIVIRNWHAIQRCEPYHHA